VITYSAALDRHANLTLRSSEDGPLDEKETALSESARRQYRKFSAQQKTELGRVSVVCA